MPKLPSRFSAPRTDFFSLRKHAGFTLIEMMVAMTIIILLSATLFFGYTGYLKNVRDAVRIADVSAMNAIVFDFRHKFGFPPASEADFITTVTAANLGQPITDPLHAKVACITSDTDSTLTYCDYAYSVCDGGEGHLISAKFESKGQVQRYTPVPGGDPGDPTDWFFNVGKCTAVPTYPPGTRQPGESCRKKTDCEPNSVCVGPPSKVCRLKNNQNNGKDCDTVADCLTPKCNKGKKCET